MKNILKKILVLATLAVLTVTAFAGGMINVKGSDTMVNLMSNLAEAYMTAHSDVTIAVTGGGSGTGVAALLNGTTEICASSRSLKDEEIKLAAAKNILPTSVTIGLDGISVMVNKNNSLSELTMEQLKKIYTGEVTNWKDFGGVDKAIQVYSRESNSGTYAYFQEHVLQKSDYTNRARLLPSTAAICKSVSDDQGAIGYGGIAYAEHANVKTVMIKTTADNPAVQPTTATVLDGTYPISRPLFLFTNGEPSGNVKSFVDFCLSPEGQKIVTDTGYITAK